MIENTAPFLSSTEFRSYILIAIFIISTAHLFFHWFKRSTQTDLKIVVPHPNNPALIPIEFLNSMSILDSTPFGVIFIPDGNHSPYINTYCSEHLHLPHQGNSMQSLLNTLIFLDNSMENVDISKLNFSTNSNFLNIFIENHLGDHFLAHVYHTTFQENAGILFIFLDEKHYSTEIESLTRTCDLFYETIQQTGVGIVHLSLEGMVKRINPKAVEILGNIPTNLTVHWGTISSCTDPDLLTTILQTGKQHLIEKDIMIHGVSMRVSESVSLMLHHNHTPRCFIVVIENLEKIHAANQFAYKMKDQFDILFQQLSDGAMLISENGTIILLNPRSIELLNYSDWREKPISIYDLEVNSHFDLIKEETAIHDKNQEINSIFKTAHGTLMDVHISCKRVVTESQTFFQYVFKDATAQNVFVEKAKYLSLRDALTGLGNRNALQQHLDLLIDEYQATSVSFALFFMDLDHFKDINDTMGHSWGDYLLQEVSERLLEQAGNGEIICRMGGDEFAILIPFFKDRNEVIAKAESIVSLIAEPYSVNGNNVRVSASLGICLYPQQGQSFDELLKHADSAMYHAKEKGKNTFQFYTEEMKLDAMERITIESLLHHAVLHDQLELYYQPQVSLDSRKIVGCEALLRWKHPSYGWISPERFIPIAERTHLINLIGEWVINATFKQAAEWHKKGLSVPISFNISARQFLYPRELVDQITSAQHTYDVPTSLIKIEVTESLLLTEEGSQEALMILSNMGYQIALDDFGTGYSSLSYLRKYPINIVKIDQSFIRNAETIHDFEMIKTIIGMADNLNMSVIAEGAETITQIDFLAQYGCSVVQGFYFSPAIPNKELEVLISNNIIFSDDA